MESMRCDKIEMARSCGLCGGSPRMLQDTTEVHKSLAVCSKCGAVFSLSETTDGDVYGMWTDYDEILRAGRLFRAGVRMVGGPAREVQVCQRIG